MESYRNILLEHFLDSLEDRKSYRIAWINVDKTVDHYHIQNPQIDENGANIGHRNLLIADYL